MTERQSLTFGPFRLDLLQSRLWRETQPIAIRPQALTVLRYLVLHSDRLVTKAELFRHVWDGRQVTDTVLRGCIHAIRVALADTADTPQYLETVGRQGYRFRLGGRPRACGRPTRAPSWAGRGKWSGCGSAGCGRWRAGASVACSAGRPGSARPRWSTSLWPACPRRRRWGSGGDNVSTPTATGNRIGRCWKPWGS